MVDHSPGCSCCGAALDPMEFDVRSALPDALLELSAEQRAAVWGNQDFQRLEGVGGFLRCLMPVRLTGGGSLTYSVWLSVDDGQLRHANAVWTQPEYLDLTLHGTVANAIKPWPGLLGVAAGAHVRDAGTLPYLVATEDNLLSRVLTEVWDRDDVLSRIWHALPVAVRQQVTEGWSVERSAGLAPRVHDGIMMFTGPGRTVEIEAFDTPAGMTPEAALARVTQEAPPLREGELHEHDGGSVRHAFWLSSVVDGRPQHELYGYCATSAGIARVACRYADAADLTWAQAVWRSARHTTA